MPRASLTIYYFAHFLVILPLLGRYETTLPLPSSITESVLKRVPIGAPRRRSCLRGDMLARPRRRCRRRAVARRTPTRRRSRSGRSADRSASSTAAQLQRGFKVYREVCQTCHGLTLLSFRNLADPGGPGFTSAQAAAVAAEYQVPADPDDQGEVKDRPARLGRPLPAAVQERQPGARALQRRAARPLGDRQGARL